MQEGFDRTNEVESSVFLKNKNLSFTADPKSLNDCEVIIVAVPTPIDSFKKPDLRPLQSASTSVGKYIKKGCVVCYESTVYPGLTETVCRQILEQESSLKYQEDFFLGYSPERVNPGDKHHSIENIVKVVSGSTPEVLDLLAKMYGAVIKAGIHRAPNIATAEAAKIIENIQRDVNIGLINELSQIFDRIGLDTQDVLAASRTKWNFLDFRPGLVGGHCIGVDPYYLSHLAEGVNFHPEMINSGRRTNDSTAKFIAEKTLKLIMGGGKRNVQPINIGILGVTFKENVSDLRNTKVIDLAEELEAFGATIWMLDPIADSQEFEDEYRRPLHKWSDFPKCDAIILAVKHSEIMAAFPLETLADKLGETNKIVIDIKATLDRERAKSMGIQIWRP